VTKMLFDALFYCLPNMRFQSLQIFTGLWRKDDLVAHF